MVVIEAKCGEMLKIGKWREGGLWGNEDIRIFSGDRVGMSSTNHKLPHCAPSPAACTHLLHTCVQRDRGTPRWIKNKKIKNARVLKHPGVSVQHCKQVYISSMLPCWLLLCWHQIFCAQPGNSIYAAFINSSAPLAGDWRDDVSD